MYLYLHMYLMALMGWPNVQNPNHLGSMYSCGNSTSNVLRATGTNCSYTVADTSI